MKTAADLVKKLLNDSEFKEELLKDLKQNSLVKEELEVHDYLFHATYEKYLPSIDKYGLLCDSPRQTWEGCNRGVIYLVSDPDEAYSYAETAQDENEDIQDENIIVLRIDASYLDKNLIVPDSNIIWDDDSVSTCVEYSKDIPPQAIAQIIFY